MDQEYVLGDVMQFSNDVVSASLKFGYSCLSKSFDMKTPGVLSR